MTGSDSDRRWRRIARYALASYCLWAFLLVVQNPGLQYDEALLVLGSVHMRHSPQELTLPHDPHTWISLRGRSFPLMTVRYVGAIKEYLCLPVFAVFGTHAWVLRVVSMLLGALGIFGISRLIGQHVSRQAGAITALLLAMNPAYVALTVFDNGTVAIWMAAFGVCCLTLSHFLRHQSVRTAFGFGLALGVGVWARANFLWLIAAGFGAALVVFRRRILMPASYWAAIVIGAITGGLPFLAYQVLSKGGTWQAVDMFSSHQSLREMLFTRLVMFSETLLSDREHRAMWNGPAMPDWQRWVFTGLVLLACCACLVMRSGRISSAWARVTTLTFLLLGAILFASRIIVAEHHLIVLVPLAAAVVAFASIGIGGSGRFGRAITVGLALLYAGCALQWQASAIEGLKVSGGIGPWSNAVFGLAGHLQQNYRGTEIKVLDWGLQNNLYVLTDAKVHTREIFPDASQEQTGDRIPWDQEIGKGGVFLLNGPQNRQLPAATIGFLRALAKKNPAVRRFDFRQRNGLAYAEIVEVDPTRSRPDARGDDSGQWGYTISMADTQFAKQLDGFHQIEENGWRWSKRNFSVILESPGPAARHGARLVLQLYVPNSIIQKLGAVTLTARFANRQLPSERFDNPGPYTLARDLEGDWIKPGPNRVEFVLDKCLPPSPADGRELGVIVASVSLESR